MFKKLNELESAMYMNLKFINSGNLSSAIPPPGTDASISMHQCLSNKYIENLDEWKDANGNYHFNSLGHVHLNQDGLKFLHEMSFGFRFKNAIFDILKGTLGYILGVLTPIATEAILWIIKNSEEIREFFLHILQK